MRNVNSVRRIVGVRALKGGSSACSPARHGRRTPTERTRNHDRRRVLPFPVPLTRTSAPTVRKAVTVAHPAPTRSMDLQRHIGNRTTGMLVQRLRTSPLPVR
jgi:hypothetical protein